MKKTLRNIFIILTPGEKRKFLRLILSDIVISILDISFLIVLLLVVNFYTRPDGTVQPVSWSAELLNKQPILLIGIFSLLFALKNWFAFFVSKNQYYFIYGVASRISGTRLSAYLEGSYSNYVNIDSSIHMRSVHHNPLDFAHYVLRGTQQVVSQGILIVITLIPILIFKPVLFSLLLLTLMPPLLLLSFMMKKRLQTIRESAKAIHGKLIQYLKEAISGFIESNIYHRKKFFLNRFVKFQLEQSRGLSEQQIVQSLPPRLIEVFVIFGLFILIVINFYAGNKSIDLITIGAFMAAAYKIIPGVVKIINSLGQIKTYGFTVQALLQHQPVMLPGKAPENAAIRSIEFSNISFGYENKPVLNQFSLAIKNGELTGISGISGKGKTTVVNILLGFLEPVSGSVLINGTASTAMHRQHYWKNISYAQQQPFLINDTILRNITLEETGFDLQRLEETVSITGLAELIDKLPDGINSMVTEDGKNVSGGQRQRIVLARAFYKKADLLILDEPFNELDRESEDNILNYLGQLARSGKMIILITHDKESLSFCSKIVSLDEK